MRKMNWDFDLKVLDQLKFDPFGLKVRAAPDVMHSVSFEEAYCCWINKADQKNLQ